MDMIERKVFELINELARLTGKQIAFRPASEEEILKFECVHGLRLPPEIRSWFRRFNGLDLGPGGLYSLFSCEIDDCSVDWYLKEYPQWAKTGWVPIADDGCGDLYIVATSLTVTSTNTQPVFFLDQADDASTYVVASGLWRFLLFFLENERFYQEKQPSYWPFNKEMVVANDPAILECKEFPLPWEANKK